MSEPTQPTGEPSGQQGQQGSSQRGNKYPGPNSFIAGGNHAALADAFANSPAALAQKEKDKAEAERLRLMGEELAKLPPGTHPRLDWYGMFKRPGD